jgi:hypothetical protein
MQENELKKKKSSLELKLKTSLPKRVGSLNCLFFIFYVLIKFRSQIE